MNMATAYDRKYKNAGYGAVVGGGSGHVIAHSSAIGAAKCTAGLSGMAGKTILASCAMPHAAPFIITGALIGATVFYFLSD